MTENKNLERGDEDTVEHKYKLPLEAIKRLIRSYYETIQSCDAENVYLSQYGSSDSRMRNGSYFMLDKIRKQLDKYGHDGKKIDDEVFDRYFKDAYERLKIYDKNHSGQGVVFFEPCNDPKCCNYTSNIFFKIKTFLKMFRMIFLICLLNPLQADGEFHISWEDYKK